MGTKRGDEDIKRSIKGGYTDTKQVVKISEREEISDQGEEGANDEE